MDLNMGMEVNHQSIFAWQICYHQVPIDYANILDCVLHASVIYLLIFLVIFLREIKLFPFMLFKTETLSYY